MLVVYSSCGFSVASGTVSSRTIARQAPQPTGFPQQEYWSGLSFPPPGDLSDRGVELESLHRRQILYRWATAEVLDSSLARVRTGTFYLYLFTLALFPISSLRSSAVDIFTRASLVAQAVKNLPAVQETSVPSLGWEDSLQNGMATHSIIRAWRIPWTKEPGRLRSIGLQRVTHNWVTNTNYFANHVYASNFFLPLLLGSGVLVNTSQLAPWENGCI